jgi:phage baseplate assembly protein W
MNTIFPDIKTKNWQLSTVGVGYIAEGVADIRQCLEIILRTVKGSDPLRPEFGCDIYKFADRPLNFAIPNITRAIIEAIQIWEKRVVLKSVTYDIVVDNPGQVQFFVTCRMANEELVDLILLYYGGGFINIHPVDNGSLTLYALFPPNPGGRRYTLFFIGDGNAIAPYPPMYGFGTIGELFTWAQSAYGSWGRWQLGLDRITLFVRPHLLHTGSLTMALVGLAKFVAPIPALAVGQNYQLVFVPDGVPPAVTPPVFTSAGDMLTWLTANYGYGTWDVVGNPYGAGDFDPVDFDSGDFDTGFVGDYVLVLYTSTVTTCVLQVNAV